MDHEHLLSILTVCTTAGVCGGLGLFLYSYRMGHYKNDRYHVKLPVELVGASLVASFIGPLFPEEGWPYASFVIGFSWVGILQVTRHKITKTVEALLGEELIK